MLKTLLLVAGLAASPPLAHAEDMPAVHHSGMEHTPSAASGYGAASAAAMERMHSGMMAAPLTGGPDHDFLVQMMPHHQGAVDMAKAILGSTEDPAIRNLAQSIVTEQSYEIELMRSMLAKLPPANQAAEQPIEPAQ